MSVVHSAADSTLDWAKQRQFETAFKSETGSTNDDAKTSALAEAADEILYLCAHQTSGRGRGKNTWLDTGGGESLLSTWSFASPQAPQAITGPRVGLALYRAATAVWPSLDWSLKAPNDLFLGGRKVAGLLLETVSAGANYRLLIGLGFNILNHPRRLEAAEHLPSAPDEGEWFQFLDQLVEEWRRAVQDCVRPELDTSVCQELASALNANVAKPFAVSSITPRGDLIFAGGKKPWTEL